jgi:hypothetical protein
MIDRHVHHAEILALKVDSYRLKCRDSPHAAGCISTGAEGCIFDWP